MKSDVYAFGVILLEVLCRKRAVDDSLDCGIATWAQDSIKAGHLKDIVDSDIRGEISPKCLKQYARLAERCLDIHPKDRPTMTDIVQSLECLLTLQEKNNYLLQTAGKTILGRMVDRLSFTDNGQNSGMDFGSLMPKKRNLLMLREKFFQENGIEHQQTSVNKFQSYKKALGLFVICVVRIKAIEGKLD
ncbi:hypothetical protein L1987_64681 [Smallanthus sonchifolius]|uniref:Uncharacterized protein n=1 Tax=Smallanthus sonchifolius TaxID=185202 RepID=A0ACB9BSJ7_9ASTR|nr:hypothetical protein L1987_64681 [Smallanthus sonchifolius]